MKRILAVIFSAILTFPVYSQSSLLINSYNRDQTSLNGDWKIIVDPYENGYYNYRYEAFDQMESPGKAAYFKNAKTESKSELLEYNFDESESLTVPGDWNSQKEKLFYYEGTVWYKKSFDYNMQKEKRLFLYFGAINYKAEVYLNGTKLGIHVGGFTPFHYEITDLVQKTDNYVVVKVDNKRRADGVPTLNTDWWNYGGITREVKLVETPQTYISDYIIQLDPDNRDQITGFIQLNGENISNRTVSIQIPGNDILINLTSDQNGRAIFSQKAENITYWSPENPKLYDVEIKTNSESLTDQIGFRTIKTSGDKIYLNDETVFLKGISIHEENPLRGGRANSPEDARILLGWAKELGANYVRLAHYPHNEHMVRLADEMGLMVWSEIPVYWTIDWENPETYLNAENQLVDMINRDKNRASVIIWAMANETPVTDARNRFLSDLAEKSRELDSTRLISAALEQTGYSGEENTRTIHDPFSEIVDVLSFNQYIGWYDGLPGKAETISWKIDIDKPVIISEFGAGAKYGFHADPLTRWSEEYQEYLYRETLQMIEHIDQLAGISPWILADFRSPRRPLPDIQDGWNRKGLISDNGFKKKAFYLLRDYYLNK